MNKKYRIAFILLGLIIAVAGCGRANNDTSGNEIIGGADAPTSIIITEATEETTDDTTETAIPSDIPEMIRINGELYYDTGLTNNAVGCGVMDGKIDKSCDRNKIPDEDNQSNFGEGFGYQLGMEEGTIEIYNGKEKRAVFATESVKNKIAERALPEYFYVGQDKVEAAITEHFTHNSMYYKPYGAVMIPAFCIFKEETCDDGRVKVYGNFWTFIYSKDGKTLFCESGGECPAAIYLTTDGDTFAVDEIDYVGDGADYEKDIKRICNGNKLLEDQYFEACDTSTDMFKARRMWYVYNYVHENSLDITAYQDYGWEPVELPETLVWNGKEE